MHSYVSSKSLAAHVEHWTILKKASATVISHTHTHTQVGMTAFINISLFPEIRYERLFQRKKVNALMVGRFLFVGYKQDEGAVHACSIHLSLICVK